MKAIVCTRYGPPEVLSLKEVETPVPKDREVLVRIYATTVTTGDCEIRSSKVRFWLWFPIRLWVGLIKPRGKAILGTEFAGVITATGKDSVNLKPGDSVFGSTGVGFGANAEYVALPHDGDFIGMPAKMNFEEAAAIPFGGRDALHFLRMGEIKAGDEVLIIGAGGSIGTFAVQLAGMSGAVVTALDSGDKLEVLRSIGATHTIDYTKEDFTGNDKKYDIIFDTVGKSSFSRSLQSLKKSGRYLLANPSLGQILRAPWASRLRGKKVVVRAAEGGKEDLGYLCDLIESGKIRPVIDRTYPLEQIVEAHRYVETGGKKGNVIINIPPPE